MRPELAVALVAGILLVLYGLVDILAGARVGSRSLDSRLARISAGVAAALIVLALALQGWRAGGWPGWMPAEALLATAGGAAVLLAVHEYNLRVRALASLLAGIVVFIAAVVSARSMPAGAPLQTESWLFGLRLLAFAPGAGMWLLGVAAAFADTGIGRTGDRETETGGETATDDGRGAIAAGYPWLTAALVLMVAWDVAAHAVIWRATAAELLLLIAWLLGGAYLVSDAVPLPPTVRRLSLAVLALAGLAAVLFAAAQAPLWV